ncbi:MAG TPA: peptidoglycan-binding domain-containing protein [Candidatus Saccharimonadales bacterium]|nr:peptidoglycan-binding domain-containing protein [Candidatus Saccharimonadales bacterium]
MKRAPAKLRKWSKAQVLSIAFIVVAFGSVGAFLLVKSNATSCIYGVFSYGRGSRGGCVQDIQMLVDYHLPASQSITGDGSFGPLTDQGVKRVQAAYKIEVDGVVGPHTWRALCTNHHSPYSNILPSTFVDFSIRAGCPALPVWGRIPE